MTLSAEQRNRYKRHLLLPEVGVEGQAKLLGSKVLMLGAGGLGSPAALYLAAAVVGTIGIVDMDVVDESNLQRQILHNMDRIGDRKVDSAKKTLTAINPDVNVVTHDLRLNADNVIEILSQYDVVVDGADNFPSRYLLNDAALKTDTVVVHGSIFRFEGQATVFKPYDGPCYRCLIPEPPPADLEERAWDELDGDSVGGIDIVSAEPGWRYTTLRPADFPIDGREIHTIRQRMTTRGYEPCNGPLYKGKPRKEYVPGRPDLEIWRMPQARADNEWRIEMARQVLDKRAAERYWRHNVKGGRKGGLPPKLEEGMLAYHGLLTLPGKRPPPTREQLIAMVRRMPVHPGKEQTVDAW